MAQLRYKWNDESVIATLRQMQAFVRGFRIEGDGVTVQKTADSFICRIARQRRDFVAPAIVPQIATLQVVDAGSIGAPYGTGVYNAVLINGRPNASPNAGPMDLPDTGEKLGTDQVILENDAENLMGAGNSHMLPIDGSCFIEARFTGGFNDETPPKQIWRTCGGWGYTAVILIDSPLSTFSGLYNGHIYAGVTSVDGTTNLTMPAGLVAGSTCLLLNTEEDSGVPTTSGTTRLKPNTYVVATHIGPSKEATPRPTFIVRGGVGRIDSPKSLPAGGLTPDTSTWNRDSDGKPLAITLCSDVVWDPTNHKILKNTRVLTFDARGLLHDATAETAATIDTAASCS